MSITNYSHTPGQHIGVGLTTKNFSIGDSLGIANYLYCWGGFNAQADEGCEAQDNQVFMGSVAYEGTLTGSPTTGAASVSINPTQGGNTQGSGRFLIRLSAGTITAGSISAIATGSVSYLFKKMGVFRLQPGLVKDQDELELDLIDRSVGQ